MGLFTDDLVLTPETLALKERWEAAQLQVLGYKISDGHPEANFRSSRPGDRLRQFGDNVISRGFVQFPKRVSDGTTRRIKLHPDLGFQTDPSKIIDLITDFTIQQRFVRCKQLCDVTHTDSSSRSLAPVYPIRSGENSAFFDVSASGGFFHQRRSSTADESGLPESR